MTFEEIKAAILSGSMPLEICEGYPDVVNATNEDELISAGREFIEWGYQQKILTESLINEISQPALNANKIYNTGTFTLTNPVQDVFIMGNANVTINISDSKKHRIVILGAGIATINLSGNSYARVQKLQSTSNVTITLNDKASCNFHFEGSGNATVTLNNSSVLHSWVRDTCILNFTGNNTSVGNIKLYETSQLTYVVNGTATLIKKAYDQAIINGSGL